MNYSMEQIKRGVAAYVDNEFMPNLAEESSIKKVLIGAGISLAITRYASMVDIYRDNQFVKALGIFDESGNVDVEAALTAIKQNIPPEGLKVDIPTMGVITLDGNDADKLKNYISQYAK